MDPKSRLKYIIHHVILLPESPQTDDRNPSHDTALLQQCCASLEAFQALQPVEEEKSWKVCRKMLMQMLGTRDGSGDLSEEEVKLTLEAMKKGDVLAFDVRAQNAGLIVRKQNDLIIFESFELSPTTSAVMATKGRLRRSFPGPAIAIGRERLNDPNFCGALAQILARLDVDTPSEIVPTVFKARSKTNEVRDTVHPKFVTELLTGILRGIGAIHDTVRFEKRTRDDALWDSTFKPWRRSPLWLLIRVALQSTLATGQKDHSRYKSFVAFFVAQLLHDCVQLLFPSDTIHMINAKISRRVLKLNLVDKSLWRTEIETLVQKAHRRIDKRWRKIEENTDPLGHMHAWHPSRLDLKADTELSLSKLQPYLDKISSRNDFVLGTREFRPSCLRRLADSISFPQEHVFQHGTDYSAHLSVLDIEHWVEKRLDQYLSANHATQVSCNSFATLIQAYVQASATIYSEDPVGESLRFLTIMELWVALDKLAIRRLPLLGEYNPGFPEGLFDPLLLLRKSQMERIARVEKYISIRKIGSVYGSSLIFEECNKSDSFGVKFFQQSILHQQLKRSIEDAATHARQAKIEEYHDKNKEHRELIYQYNRLVCDTVTRLVNEEEEVYHLPQCKRCRTKSKADSIDIHVYEWPLPEKQVEAEAAVFELDVPVDFVEWRDVTHALMVDVFSPRDSVDPNITTVYLLHQYEGLRNRFRQPKDRIHLASISKSFMVTHYRARKITMATATDVCLNNGLHYEMYDSRLREWTPRLLNKCDLRKVCTAQLPPGPFQKLQYALDSTTHTSNEVVARQSDCPPSLSLHEYYPFASLRSGHRLQWGNIARELTTRILRFDQEETYLLVFQTACQAGCVGESATYRDSHANLANMDFGATFMFSLGEALGAIEGNWQNTVAMRTFVVLAIRLLSMSPHMQIHHTCYRFLRRARKIALVWSRDLGKLCENEQDEKVLETLTLRALETALVLHSTFDIDDDHVYALINTDEDVADISECSIMVHDHCPAITHRLPHNLILLLRRFERTCHRLESHSRSLIIDCPAGLDQTLQRVWSGYKAGCPWSSLPSPNDRWLVTQTSSDQNESSVSVHYNVLDGSLLVNGLPLTRLPTTYEAHPTYQRLLGEKILTVVISTMSGMAFETRSEFLGQQIHFDMKDSELIIRTQKGDQICELIPCHALGGDFAQALVREYAHFLDIKSKRIEWRPLKNAWQPSSENWQMYLDPQSKYFLGHGSKSMLDVRSATAKSIFSLLSPIESSPHIHISFDSTTESAEVELPRMRLQFFLEKNGTALMSKQFRGMAVDTNQSFGALTGLTNKLVLRHLRAESRCVIVPYGVVNFAKQGNHVKVTISTSAASHVDYHIYQIDDRLGRLVDNHGSLRSKLFKAYLHATTSHCLVDRLTGRTGTEEALDILGGAAVRSFVELLPGDLELLQNIAQLTPQRQYYPSHLRVMQQTEWKNLPPLSQHCMFFKHVAEIFELAKTLQLFDEQPSSLPELSSRGDPQLLERAMIRDSSFQVQGFGAESFSASYDIEYESRDMIIDGARELDVCRVSTLVDHWSNESKVSTALLSKLESWSSGLHGPSRSNDETLELGFDLKWLADPAAIFPHNWCRLHDMLAQSNRSQDKYGIMMLLSTLAYSSQADQDLVHTLLAFATVPALRMSLTPSFSQFTLDDGYEPVLRKVINIVKMNSVGFINSPDHKLPRWRNENQNMFTNRRKRSYEEEMKKCAARLAQDLVSQWPNLITNPMSYNYSSYIRVNDAMKTLRVLFSSWYRNSEFLDHMRQNQRVLDSITPNIPPWAMYSVQLLATNYSPRRSFVELSDMTSSTAPNLLIPGNESFSDWIESDVMKTADHDNLAQLLSQMSIETSSGTHENEFLEGLSQSFSALKESIQFKLRGSLTHENLLISNVSDTKAFVLNIRQRLCDTLESPVCSISKFAGMLPRTSPLSILQHLASEKIGSLPPRWKVAFIEYGLAITALQRAQRLVATLGQDTELLSELQNNGGHQGWDPFARPDWLLLELENDILIWEEQAQIAEPMMAPELGKNTVMQLNMGLGKSSVIVPIIAAALADTSQLVRVIVLKPLAMQMFRLLVAKLGGLLQRRIVYLPISRSLPLTSERACQIRKVYEECMKSRAILLLQPEHILSFELMGFEQLASGTEKLAIGKIMAETQNWLYANSRDILDESDEILSVKFELIYTMGIQRAIDFSPERWVTIQHVLNLLAEAAVQVKKQFPAGLEILTAGKGAVPRIRILETEACQKLLESLVQQICKTGLPGVPVWNLPESTRQKLFKFLTNSNLVSAEWDSLKESFSESMRNGVLLLRGLFAGGGLLRFALKEKRWRVNFGLDLKRTMLAVPYHAKDTPSPRAEFSHPDTAIILTCLSYYYGTLSDQQVRASFEALLKFDHAKEEYVLWVNDAPTLPAQFRSLDSVNLRNSGQFLREVCPAIKGARSIINFYLSTIVFPTEMKEFEQKISSSGWDLATEKLHPTTGFSGTNDSKYVLPLSIAQCDQPKQLATNAFVLKCLLRAENGFLNDEQQAPKDVLNASTILDAVVALKQAARVILDVGAQVLELSNEEFAQAWLSKTPSSDTQAVVFFNSRDEICVLGRDGKQETLASSPYLNQMDQCLVYLDESHTRGTDLKLPTNYRALVTLGPGLTKDRLVQACMRMRKLGKGQSVIFCGSLEVQRKILACCHRDSGPIDVADVLKWCIATTCSQTRKSIPLWATQGIRHQHRHAVNAMSDDLVTRAKLLLENEAQTLQQRYGESSSDARLSSVPKTSNVLYENRLQEIYAVCRQFGVSSFTDSTLQEEQERELSPETEREQQVEHPPPATPLVHSLHPDVECLVASGVLVSNSDAFQPAFKSLRNTTCHQFFESGAWPEDLLVTADFANTIKATQGQQMDFFVRPVNWVITFGTQDELRCVVLSPFEAHQLLPAIRQYKKVVLHIYSPKTSVSIPSFERLDFCPIPTILRTRFLPDSTTRQLNLFAGQLYFRSFEEYKDFCAFLGLCSSAPAPHLQVATDGFMHPKSRGNSVSKFKISPVAFVRSVMVMRRKGQGISSSHIGKILNGELIPREIFEIEDE